MSKSDYLEAKLLEHSVGKTAYTMPSVWVALYTAAPSDSGGGTEVTGGSYARKSTAGADWGTAVTGNPSQISNANTITFVTATGNWGTITHFGLLDASSGGNLLHWAPVTTTKIIGTGDVASFPASNLIITED